MTINERNRTVVGFIVSVLIYCGLALYLYLPHFENFRRRDFLFVVSAVAGALGSFVLSRRWVGSVICSFFAGAVYGFGPFALSFNRFHPTASLLVAAIPWLFCPAVFAVRRRWRWAALPLAALPFIAIVLFFQLSVHVHLFAVPAQASLHLRDLTSLIVPLAAAKRGLTDTNLIGFYHVPLSCLVIGIWMLLAARRKSVMVIFAIGVVLACFGPVLQVSPIVWLTLPVLCLAILIGEGMQGLIFAGGSDKKPLLVTIAVMGSLAIVALLLATKYFQFFASLGDEYARLLVTTAVMYLLGAVSIAMVFFAAKIGLRVAPVRQAVLIAAMSIDIFLGARFIVDAVL